MVLRIETIDTKDQAQIFAKRLVSSSQIYFLDGAWGSGKSEYLEKVESYLPKQYKCVRLMLWKPRNKATLAKKLFAATNPRLSCLLTLSGWILISTMVFGSVVLTYESVMPTSNTRNIPLLITSIAVIVTTLYGFLKDKWLDVDRIRMAVSSSTLRSKKHHKILIVDDFDRLDEKLQEELYIFFNSVRIQPTNLAKKFSEPARIIFVGDLRKLKNTEDNYLGKIIDQKVVLPVQLQSNSVGHYMANKLRDKLDCNCSTIEQLFSEEERTPRDANQFLAYVEREIIEQQKVGKVQLDQQLLVVYLYLFHPDEYHMLLNGWLPDAGDSSREIAVTNKSLARNNRNKIRLRELMKSMFQPRSSNPPDIRTNESAYFVNELATNHSLFELREIIDSDSVALNKMLSTSEPSGILEYEEFYHFVENMKKEEYKAVQLRLEQSAMSVMKSEVRHQPNSLIRLIFKKRCDVILDKDRDIQDKDLITKYNEIFVREGIVSPTECMFYYRACMNLYGKWELENNGGLLRSIPYINDENIREYYKEDAERTERRSDFGNSDYDAEALIVQLGYSYYLDGPINPSVNVDFQPKVESIEKLKPSEYQAFWRVYNIFPYIDDRAGQADRAELSGSKALEFDYEGEQYSVNVLRRLIQDS